MNTNQLVTAYVDGEITDPSKINEIKNLVENDKSIKFDYKVQVQTKLIISEELKIKPVPEQLRKKIIKKIKPSKNFLKTFFS